MFKTLHEEIINLALKNNLTIATCESVTGGMIASYLTSVPKASKVFKGGEVVYTNFAKQVLASVKPQTLDQFGAISTQTAQELALNINKKLKTDIALAISGNAGADPDENKPVGMAYLSICVIDKVYNFQLVSKEKERNNIRIDFTHMAYNHLLEIMKKVIKND